MARPPYRSRRRGRPRANTTAAAANHPAHVDKSKILNEDHSDNNGADSDARESAAKKGYKGFIKKAFGNLKRKRQDKHVDEESEVEVEGEGGNEEDEERASDLVTENPGEMEYELTTRKFSLISLFFCHVCFSALS